MITERVLLIDDDINMLASLKRLMRREGFIEVLTAENSESALAALTANKPVAVIVSDYRMPGVDGIELLSQAQALFPETVRMMLTGMAELDVALNAINRGKIFRFLLKPITPEDFLIAIRAGIDQYRLITSERELLEKTLKGSIKILFEILALINPAIFERANRLRMLAQNVTACTAPELLWETELAALLSQIGVAILPKDIQQKKEKGMILDEREEALYFSHPKFGKLLVNNIPRLEGVAEAIYYQYKHFNGDGFPPGKAKEMEIPFTGRLLKVIMDFDELIQQGNAGLSAIEVMYHRWGVYDPIILSTLEKFVKSQKQAGVVKSVAVEEVEEGMILAKDVVDQKGKILYPLGTIITDVMVIQLRNFQSYNVLVTPIQVYEKEVKTD